MLISLTRWSCDLAKIRRYFAHKPEPTFATLIYEYHLLENDKAALAEEISRLLSQRETQADLIARSGLELDMARQHLDVMEERAGRDRAAIEALSEQLAEARDALVVIECTGCDDINDENERLTTELNDENERLTTELNDENERLTTELDEAKACLRLIGDSRDRGEGQRDDWRDEVTQLRAQRDQILALCNVDLSPEVPLAAQLASKIRAIYAAPSTSATAEPKPDIRFLSWDWREQIDLNCLARIVAEVSGGRVRIAQVETCTDEYAIAISASPLDQETAAAERFRSQGDSDACICNHTVHAEIPGSPSELHPDASCPQHGEVS